MKSSSPVERLSDREFEVFKMIGEGKERHQIAQQLCISAKTIDTHRVNIRNKLQLAQLPALTRYAARWVETQKIQGDALDKNGVEPMFWPGFPSL